MSGKISEITDLFARLATDLEGLNLPEIDDRQESLDVSISKMNQSLNLKDHSENSILDTLLSLMCYRAPQVFESRIEYLVNTIVAVLSSSIACEVLRIQKSEFLKIGCGFSCHDSASLLGGSADILAMLRGNEQLSHLLVSAVVKCASLASVFRHGQDMTPILEESLRDSRSSQIADLLDYIPNVTSFKDEQIPLRLLLWNIDPLILKNDVSQILQDYTCRLFLSLRVEFYHRMDWRMIVKCLVLSPTIFIETCSLLHKWFLLTGSASVLDLQSQLISTLLDVLSRPMWWDLSEKMGLKMSFPCAYFPHDSNFLKTLSGPLSCKAFQKLLAYHMDKPNCRHRSSDATAIDVLEISWISYKSPWALAMNFPDWFFLASSLLFAGKDFVSHFCCKDEQVDTNDEHVCYSAEQAARYISWLLNPINEYNQELLCKGLTQISETLVLKRFSSQIGCQKKKVKKAKLHKDTNNMEYDMETIKPWLREFNNLYIDDNSHRNLLFRRIPLGIMISFSGKLSEEECLLLLHYAATGKIWNSGSSTDHLSQQREAVAGARLIFYLTDVVENMSDSMFEGQGTASNFVWQFKLRASRYLFNCVNRIIEMENGEEGDGLIMLKDLHNRLMRWRCLGHENFQGCSDLDNVLAALHHKLSA